MYCYLNQRISELMYVVILSLWEKNPKPFHVCLFKYILRERSLCCTIQQLLPTCGYISLNYLKLEVQIFSSTSHIQVLTIMQLMAATVQIKYISLIAECSVGQNRSRCIQPRLLADKWTARMWEGTLYFTNLHVV